MAELHKAIGAFDADANISCLVLTGSEKAFAAGADIKEMANLSFLDAFMGDFAGTWVSRGAGAKAIIAAVAGFALGGGCNWRCNAI